MHKQLQHIFTGCGIALGLLLPIAVLSTLSVSVVDFSTSKLDRDRLKIELETTAGVIAGALLLSVGTAAEVKRQEKREIEVRFSAAGTELTTPSKESIEKLQVRRSDLKQYPCQGCQYWHGEIYEHGLLVCAIHPHGPEGDCPDWEEKRN